MDYCFGGFCLVMLVYQLPLSKTFKLITSSWFHYFSPSPEKIREIYWVILSHFMVRISMLSCSPFSFLLIFYSYCPFLLDLCPSSSSSCAPFLFLLATCSWPWLQPTGCTQFWRRILTFFGRMPRRLACCCSYALSLEQLARIAQIAAL